METVGLCVLTASILRAQNIQGLTGTPMVAASPERHDGGLQANPVEVQSYQPPWKVLSDFALQSDIDQPAFQQLVRRFLLTVSFFSYKMSPVGTGLTPAPTVQWLISVVLL